MASALIMMANSTSTHDVGTQGIGTLIIGTHSVSVLGIGVQDISAHLIVSHNFGTNSKHRLNI